MIDIDRYNIRIGKLTRMIIRKEGRMGGYGLAGDSAFGFPEDDFDLDAHIAWTVREIDAGRQQVPPEPAAGGPAVTVSLGDACDVDPELLAAMCGPGGLGGEAVSAAFGQDETADVLRPGPVLAALTSRAAADAGALSNNELTGALQAARRLANLAAYQQTVVIAEFARRRQAEFEAAKARGVSVGCRAGEYPGEELAMELVETRSSAGARIDAAVELTGRLPRTLEGMAAGLIDLGRAHIIAARTQAMTDADAAFADQVLAAAAPGRRLDQLAARAAALEMRLAPEAVAARKELARRLGQRVEARREDSGNASLAGRELDTADVMASKAHIDGTLGRLRAMVMIDLTQGRDPLDRIKPSSSGGATPAASEPQTATAPASDDDAREWAMGQVRSVPGHAVAGSTAGGDEAADAASRGSTADEPDEQSRRGWARPGEPVPLPALINILVPAGTLLGWDTAPATAASWGLLDAGETAALVRAASAHPRTRWCITVLAPDGTAIAHGCARGRHPWPPDGPAPPGDPPGNSPPAPQAARLANLLRCLNITPEPIARDTCDHARAEDRYVPGRALRHLLRARHQTCTAPACNA